MRLIIACAMCSIVLGALQSLSAEEAVKRGDKANVKELAQVKQMLEDLSARIQNLERGQETEPVAKTATDKLLLSRRYDLEDFAPMAPRGIFYLDKIKRYITAHIAPQQWEGAGGQGIIRVYHQNLCLVITQTEEVHTEISQRLSQLREAKALLRDLEEDAQEPPSGQQL